MSRAVDTLAFLRTDDAGRVFAIPERIPAAGPRAATRLAYVNERDGETVAGMIRHVDGLSAQPPVLLEVRDVCLVGNLLMLRDERPFYSPIIHPRYLPALYEKGISIEPELAALKGTLREQHVPEPHYVFYHPHCKYFGHFLTEAVPALISIRLLYDQGTCTGTCPLSPANLVPTGMPTSDLVLSISINLGNHNCAFSTLPEPLHRRRTRTFFGQE